MCIGSRGRSAVAPAAALIASVIALLSASAAPAQPASVEELVSAVVRINTHITPDGRTVQGLGREREGSGILIDADGLVLTIGYLMVEAVDRLDFEASHLAVLQHIKRHRGARRALGPDLAIKIGQVLWLLAIDPDDDIAALDAGPLCWTARRHAADE